MRKVKEFREMVRAGYFRCEDKQILIHCYKIFIKSICIKPQFKRFILAMAIIAKIHLRLSLMSQMIINKIIHMHININNQMREQYLE